MMAIEKKDFIGLQAKRATQEPEVVIRTVESSEAWQLLVGWLEAQAKNAEAKKSALVDRYINDPLWSYELMAKQKALLDIANAEVLIYRQVLDRMNQFHPQEIQ